MQIDIVIVNYHCADQIAECLKTLGPWRKGAIWLVDNSCDPIQKAALEALAEAHAHSCVRLVLAQSNLGFGGGCNLAFARSTAELLLLLNPDALVTGATVLELAQDMQRHPHLGALSPTIYWNRQRTFVTPATMAQTPWAELLRLASHGSARIAKGLARLHLRRMRHIAAAGTLQTVAFLSGAVLMLRRSAALEASRRIEWSAGDVARESEVLFDPAFFMFFEDSDLSVRLTESGWALGVLPCVSAVHEYRHKAFKASLMQQSRHLYFRKRYPIFYQYTQNLLWLDTMAAKMRAPAWSNYLGEFSRADEVTRATGGDGVIALSPSGFMVPAIFRPPGGAYLPFDEEEWALLEPAHYTACLIDARGNRYHVSWALIRS